MKKRLGEIGFNKWWNGLDVYYHPDAIKELEKELKII